MLSGTRLAIFVLPWNSTSESLKASFEAHGTVTDAEVLNKDIFLMDGFGFMEFSSPEETGAALKKMNSAEVDGRVVSVFRAD